MATSLIRRSRPLFAVSILACAIAGLPACSGDGNGRTDAGSAGGSPGLGGRGTGGDSGGSGGAPGTGGGASGGSTGSGGSGNGGASSGSGGSSGGGRGGTGAGGASSGSGGSSSGGRGGSVSGSGGASGGRGGNASGGASSGGGRGGNASGGASATGGRGGSASGGASGSGGHGGSAGSGTAKSECVTAEDCKLVSDCCTCAAVPNGEAAPACDLVCIQSHCAAQQLPQGAVACVAGRCVAGFNCDASKVTCKIAVPNCPAGEVPGVNAEGSCYSGGCVPAVECKTVTSCAACTGPGVACATYQTKAGPQAHCVSVPASCGASATCGCLGPTTCVSPYTSCNDASSSKGVMCTCPFC